MIPIHVSRYSATSTGQRIVDVVCERCDCEYHYVLSRIGSGSGAAVYGIGGEAAQKSAGAMSKEELGRKLDDEAELVPCPKCHWVGAELVDGYRRGLFRKWPQAAWKIALIGSITSWIIAWYVATGRQEDLPAIPYFVIGGPSVACGVAIGVLIAPWLLRSRVRPNRDYPFPPKPPLGTPPALIRNTVSGEFEIADKDADKRRFVDDWIVIHPAFERLPAICCGCLGPPESSRARVFLLKLGLNVLAPLCPRCAGRWSARQWLGWLIALATSVGACWLIIASPRIESPVTRLGVVFAGVVAFCLGVAVANRWAALVVARVVDASRGVVKVWFRNPSYLKRMTGSTQDEMV